MAGDPDLRLAPERRARFAHITVGLAEMHPVRPQPLGQRDAVVNDERAIVRRADLLQRAGELSRLVLIDPLDPELERGDRRGGQRAIEPGGKVSPHLERRDQVELAQRSRVRILATMLAHAYPLDASPAAPVRVGCSGWMYKHWRGLFYPEKLPVKHWFAFYAATFDTVEINNSFYRLPPPATFAGWRGQAPPGFRYAVKANRYLTQAKKLKDCEEPIARMMASVSELRPALGPLLFQLPPRFQVNLDRLERFLAVLPGETANVFEFREPSWYCDAVYALLERYGASLCVHDMPGLASPRIALGPIAYIRFHGAGGKYVGRYSDAALQEWAEWIAAEARGGRAVWAYFNNDIHGHAIDDAKTLSAMVGQALPGSVQTAQRPLPAISAP